MQQRRRISTSGAFARARLNPVLATLLVVSLVATAAFGGHQILNTQGTGAAPIEVKNTTASLNSGENVVVDDAASATQGDGEADRTVKEFTSDEPFSMLGITWHGPADVAAYVRAERDDGSWSEWYDTESVEMAGDNGKTGTELLYIEPTTRVQVNISGVDLLLDDTDEATEEATEDSELAPLPSNYGDIQPVADTGDTDADLVATDVEVVFIDGGEGLATGGISNVVDSSNTAGMPDVITRAQWGANEAIRCSEPTYVEPVNAVTVHHTAGSNNYTEAQAPGIVRGIYNYHAKELNWCDTGYAALVDKYGNIYEGRYGGMDRAVKGAHVGGFNENTWGVSILGNYMTAYPTEEAIRSVGEIAGWKAAVSNFDPLDQNWHQAEFNFQGSKYAKGQGAMFPNINAHRDFHYNLCPGDHVYARMDDIRAIADERYRAIKSGVSAPSTATSTSASASANANQPSIPANAKPGDTITVTAEDGTVRQYVVRERDVTKEPTPQQNTGIPSGAQDALIASSQGDTQAQVTVGLSVAILAIAYALREGLIELPGGAQSLGEIPVFRSLTVSDISALANGAATLSSDSAISQKYQELNRTLGPVLGQATTRELRSGVEVHNTGIPAVDSLVSTAVSYIGGEDAGKSLAFFEEGLILHTEETGTRALWGRIADAWINQGMDLGELGLPLNEEYFTGEGSKVRVDFQGGYISFDPATGALDIQHS